MASVCLLAVESVFKAKLMRSSIGMCTTVLASHDFISFCAYNTLKLLIAYTYNNNITKAVSEAVLFLIHNAELRQRGTRKNEAKKTEQQGHRFPGHYCSHSRV